MKVLHRATYTVFLGRFRIGRSRPLHIQHIGNVIREHVTYHFGFLHVARDRIV